MNVLGHTLKKGNVVQDIRRKVIRKPVTTGDVVGQDPQKNLEEGPSKDNTLDLNPKRLWKKMGPGLITGASDDDPSGIGTYSVAGAQFGYSTLWLALLTYPCSIAVQELCARIGLLTGHGLATTIKKYYGKPILAFLAILLFSANTINVGADLQAMSGTLNLLVPSLPYGLIAIGFAILTLILLIALPYRIYCRFLKYTTITLFSYVFVAFFVHANWPAVFHNLLVPTLSSDPVYLMALVGILGTTISPYMFFWQANEEVEEEISLGIIRNDTPEAVHRSLLHRDPKMLKDMRTDVSIGMLYSQVIMFFIITATASTIYTTSGAPSVSSLSLAQLANVLQPLVGDTAFFLFSLGIIGTGLLAIPVLAGSASYAVSELFGWQEGLNKKFHEAKGFYIVIVLSTVIGLSLNSLGISPVSALFYTAILNGVVAVPMLIIIWRIGNNKKILGDHTSGWLSNIFMGVTLTIMAAAAIAMFILH